MFTFYLKLLQGEEELKENERKKRKIVFLNSFSLVF